MRNLLMLICVLVQPAMAADAPISPAEFEALVTGKTLSYSTSIGEYGAEEYLEGRRVRWSYLDGTCTDGRWYDVGDQVCFVYEGIEFPQCWKFFMDGDKLMARFVNADRAPQLFEASKRPEPLMCYGPEIGA